MIILFVVAKELLPIKSKKFIENYFADPDFLVETIRIYNEKYRGRDPLNLFNLLHCAL